MGNCTFLLLNRCRSSHYLLLTCGGFVVIHLNIHALMLLLCCVKYAFMSPCFLVSPIDCGSPTLPSGVTVVQPHTTTVSSVIVYQCQQSGFVPSSPSSVCGEDGRWSPDPSQVVCSVAQPATGTKEQ